MAIAALLAACGSSSSSSTSSAPTTAPHATTTPTTAASGAGALGSLSNSLGKSTTASFSATYSIVGSSKTQTVTFAQDPPKSAITTPQASFLVSGTSVTECSGPAGSVNCATVPSSMTASLASITNLFSPAFLHTVLNGLQSQEASHVAGLVVKSSGATYAGLESTCVTVTTTASPSPATYCASKTTGLLTYSSVNGNTVTLTAYAANPPASTFEPPAGATITTIPTGA